MVKIIFAIQWLVTGTIGAFPKCLLMLIKKNLASEVLWKKRHLNQPLFRSRWFYSVYYYSHCTKCIAEAGLQNWLWEHCEHWAHMTRAVWVFPDVCVTSGETGLSAVTGLPGQTRRLKSSEASFSNSNGDSWPFSLKLSSLSSSTCLCLLPIDT